MGFLCEMPPGHFAGGSHPALADPWAAALTMPGVAEGAVVLAILTDTLGPAYRLAGAAMAIGPDDHYAGAITSGCVEADLILQAVQVRRDGRMRRLRYGVGSPFFDLTLPCGGGIEVTLIALRDVTSLQALAAARAARRKVSLRLSATGRLALASHVETGLLEDGSFAIGFCPPVRHLVFGAGPEAIAFAQLAQAGGAEVLLLSHEASVLALAAAHGIAGQHFTRLTDLEAMATDAETAITLFYHDHDVEPGILEWALCGRAFYIGAQGSRRAQADRLHRLAERGVSQTALARVRGPIGLIASTRDARALAVSVLAEITAVALERHAAPTAPRTLPDLV